MNALAMANRQKATAGTHATEQAVANASPMPIDSADCAGGSIYPSDREMSLCSAH